MWAARVKREMAEATGFELRRPLGSRFPGQAYCSWSLGTGESATGSQIPDSSGEDRRANRTFAMVCEW